MIIADDEPSRNGREESQAHEPRLLEHHRAELHLSGLSDETIAAAGIYSETDAETLAGVLNRESVPKKLAPAITFPFRDQKGPTGYVRAKPDTPRKISSGIVKYESPAGQPNQVYFPPNTISVLDDPSVPLLITEGEKKALMADQEGFACVGLVGVYGWKKAKREQLLPQLANINLRGRDVFIVFDSDREKNPMIRQAEARLALCLQREGANVRIVQIPSPSPTADGNKAKVGVDDFLVEHGVDAFRQLIAEAVEPEIPSSVQLRLPAGDADPATVAGDYLDAQCIDGVRRLIFWRGGWWRWEDGRYSQQSPARIKGAYVRFLNEGLSMLGTKEIGNFFAQLQAQAAFSDELEPACWIGEPPNGWRPTDVVVCKDRIVHIPSLTASQVFSIPATPKLFTPAAMPFDFDADAPEPTTWLNFLDQLWPNDPESVETLQQNGASWDLVVMS